MKIYSDGRNRLTDKRARCGRSPRRPRGAADRGVSIGSVSVRDETHGSGRRRRRDRGPRPLPSAIRRRAAGAKARHLRDIRTRLP
ncbi:hypothetical protein EVAR_69355_1 [Eumeta japonica]|uniref:Uncharacterized protein n=1 Tax=Eumeta variegata TaxID=151549 RepID=A0A4C2A294_EUMVA|nr:hypothetical protein EVAR_69355_1 [Eumeta japonica]